MESLNRQKDNVDEYIDPILENLYWCRDKSFGEDVPILDPFIDETPDNTPAPYLTYSWNKGQTIFYDGKYWDNYTLVINYFFAPPVDSTYIGKDKRYQVNVRSAYSYQKRQELLNMVVLLISRKNPYSDLYQYSPHKNMEKKKPHRFRLIPPVRFPFDIGVNRYGTDTAQNWSVSQSIDIALLNKKLSEVCS